MGETAAGACGLQAALVGSNRSGPTTAEDTRSAAREMAERRVRLILFAGGDGTARDVHDALGHEVPVLGIPAGVKIHSEAFTTHPAAAGVLALAFLQGSSARLREAEIIDLDEEVYRAGRVATRLYGTVRVPYDARRIQGGKTPSGASEEAAQAEIAATIIRQMEPGTMYILGPGTTTRAIAAGLRLPKTLVGVDVVAGRELVAADANEAQLMQLLGDRQAKIVVTPVGGQGCILGRGNQQISPRVIRQVGCNNIVVAATVGKIHALEGRPLWVDTGDSDLDRQLAGYVQVIAGSREAIVYRVEA